MTKIKNYLYWLGVKFLFVTIRFIRPLVLKPLGIKEYKFFEVTEREDAYYLHQKPDDLANKTKDEIIKLAKEDLQEIFELYESVPKWKFNTHATFLTKIVLPVLGDKITSVEILNSLEIDEKRLLTASPDYDILIKRNADRKNLALLDSVNFLFDKKVIERRITEVTDFSIEITPKSERKI